MYKLTTAIGTRTVAMAYRPRDAAVIAVYLARDTLESICIAKCQKGRRKNVPVVMVPPVSRNFASEIETAQTRIVTELG